MLKLCTSCQAEKPLSAFATRSLSKDGHAASCRVCINERNRRKYTEDTNHRAAAVARAVASKQRRFETEPGYRRAFNLWGSTKKRGVPMLPWMTIADFVPICRIAERRGDEYVLDHIVPLNHPLVSGLHVPWNLRVVKQSTNKKKGSTFRV